MTARLGEIVRRWRAQGTFRTLLGRRVFTVEAGPPEAEPVVFLHGFPSSSWDWHRLIPLLSADHRLVMMDFLGFGLSAKPKRHRYSLFEQADLVSELVRQLGCERIDLVSHDMGNSVALELIRRGSARSFEIRRYVMTNGSVLLTHYRPVVSQRLLLTPWVGEVAARLTNRLVFGVQFARVFAADKRPTREETDAHWQLIVCENGHRNAARLIRYIHERRRYEREWLDALAARRDMPLAVVWGLLDPVSVPRIAQEVLARRPDATYVPLPESGHYPQLEQPEPVAAAIGEALTG